MVAIGFCGAFAVGRGTATRLLVFGAALGAACCAWIGADGAVAAATGGLESIGGGGPVAASGMEAGAVGSSPAFG